MSGGDGLSTRSVHGGIPAVEQGAPFLGGPTFASAYHFAGDDTASVVGYARTENPSWVAYELALAGLEGGRVSVYPSGMAAASAVLAQVRPGEAVVVPADGYFGVREVAERWTAPGGVEVREVPTDHDAIVAAMSVPPAPAMVWIETPSNPAMDLLDIARLRADIGPAPTLVVDNTVATPYFQRPLALGADVSMASASKHLTGHSDLLLGYVATADAELDASLRAWRTKTGSIAGPFETWLAHRSLATFAIRVERASENAAAIAELLRGDAAATGVRYPGFGTVLGFELADAAAVTRFFAASRLVAEATSFGGVHSSAERRGRWGTDAVAEGFIRFSAGIEDGADLLADVSAALRAALG